jgi:hypothetical protein
VTEHAIPGNSWLDHLAPAPVTAASPVIAEVSQGLNTEPHLPVSRGPMRTVITDSLHYIRNGDGVEELYAWRSDPAEAHNLATTVANALGVLRALIETRGR